jgi:hypothetical protein
LKLGEDSFLRHLGIYRHTKKKKLLCVNSQDSNINITFYFQFKFFKLWKKKLFLSKHFLDFLEGPSDSQNFYRILDIKAFPIFPPTTHITSLFMLHVPSVTKFLCIIFQQNIAPKDTTAEQITYLTYFHTPHSPRLSNPVHIN